MDSNLKTYPVKTMLGIYVYGYLNRIRSSRQLAKSCQKNVELAKKKQSQRRSIDRYEYQDAIDRNKEEVTARKEEYCRRQAIVEASQRGHFTPLLRIGTIKRQWGYNYTLLKTIPKVQTEFLLIFHATI